MPISSKLGMGQVVFSPLAQGVLTSKYKPGEPFPSDSRAANDQMNGFLVGRPIISKESLEVVQRLSELAEKELGVSMAALALAWCLRLPNISSVITGATKTRQIEENIKAAESKLQPDVLARIEDLLAPVKVH